MLPNADGQKIMLLLSRLLESRVNFFFLVSLSLAFLVTFCIAEVNEKLFRGEQEDWHLRSAGVGF